jgi:hypothetical protein
MQRRLDTRLTHTWVMEERGTEVLKETHSCRRRWVVYHPRSTERWGVQCP